MTIFPIKLVFIFSFLAFLSVDVHATGKKQTQDPSTCGTSSASNVTPHPTRKVVLTPIGTRPFQLPNMNEVDLSVDLKSLLATSVTNTQSNSAILTGLSVTDPVDGLPCSAHLELRASVSTLELGIATLGIKFGYSPSGAQSVVSKVEGSVEVNIGTISMDFALYECMNGQCSTRAAAMADQTTLGGDIKFMVNFGDMSVGPEFVWKTAMGVALRKIMDAGLLKLASSPQMNKVAWEAKVREYVPETGTIFFDAGSNVSLLPNQTFVVYAVEPAVGICDVYKAVAYIRTNKVDAISSTASVDSIQDARGVKAGDLVMIRMAQ